MHKVVGILLVMLTASVSSDLVGSAWIQIPEFENAPSIECPIQLHFDELKYRYLNPCYEKGRNKVVEFGGYSESQSGLWLENRFVVVGGGSVFGEDAQSMLLESFEVDGERLSFRIGETAFLFARQ